MFDGKILPISLYYKDATGGIRVWQIRAENFQIIMEHGVLGGSVQSKFESVPYGIGGRTRQEQLCSRFNSRIKSKIDKGYTHNIDDAKAHKPTNQLGLLKPMLAARFDKCKNIDYKGSLLQYKYDGHRCVVTKQNGDVIAYSRNGNLINSIDHILDGIEIEEGQFLDGELYIHGMKLQKISSLIKRPQEDSKLLKYFVYDLISSDTFHHRFLDLNEIKLGKYVEIAKTWPVMNPSDIPSLLDCAIADGYEGLILRLDGAGYKDGKRSKEVIKIKKFFDDEYIVIGVLESVDGWGRLKCLMKSGKVFYTSAPGNMEQKIHVARNPCDYIGKMVSVKYAGFTSDGKPFHPIATDWRNKAQE